MKNVTPAGVGKDEIRRLIPHAGSMCLLDKVEEWDEHAIACTSHTHLDRSNPLRRDEHLSAIHAFEYAAQAVAVHGSLCARSADSVAPPGYLAALRNASMQVAHLDRLNSALDVRARRLFGDSANSVYEGYVSAGNVPVAQGRITIVLRPLAPSQGMKEDRNERRGRVPVRQTSSSVFETHRRVSLEHPSLPGHFPGESIVPGVVILDEIAEALVEWRRYQISRIDFAKFLSPLLPEQTFAIFLAAINSPVTHVEFQCQVANRPIVKGRIEVICHD